MGDISLQLATLIGSRICHDLISPVGAISNGLELLGLSGQMNGPEFDLISESVSNAGARIRFFRIAYGAAGEQVLGRPEIVSLLEDIGHGARIRFHWRPVDTQPRSEVRLAFLALQCCETAMPYGGDLAVDTDGKHWTITGLAEKHSANPALWSHLGASPDPTVEIGPPTVQFALLPLIARDMRKNLTYSLEDGKVSIAF